MQRLSPLWLAVPGLLGACGSDTTTPPASPGDVTLAITQLLPQDSQIWCSESAPESESCTARQPEPVVIGCDRELGVTVDVQNFSLRVPDACGSSPQCGFLSVTLDPDTAPITVTGAAKTLLFDLKAVEKSLKERDESLTLDGDHVLRPALLLASGRPFTHPFTADPLDVPVTFQTVPDADCVDPTGGTGGAAGSAGKGGTGGSSGSNSGGSAGNALGGAAGEASGGAAGETHGGEAGTGAGESAGGQSGQGGAPNP
jgi:hypothetical protein